jgi:hypothetical protein
VSRMVHVLAHLVANTGGEKGTVLHSNRHESKRTHVQIKSVTVKAEHGPIVCRFGTFTLRAIELTSSVHCADST